MKLERVVVGVDFCGPSVEAARWTALHFAPEAEIALVHSVDVPEPPGFLRGGLLPPNDERTATAREGALRRLEALGRWTADPRVTVDVRVAPAAEALVRAVDETAADLLVVGAHARRPGIWDALGSTAERAIADAAVPVLLARTPPPAEPRRILVAVGGSVGAERELAWARFLAVRFDAEVEILHAVLPPRLAPLEVAAGAATPAELEASRDSARRWIAGASAAAGFETGEADLRIEVGDPVREILAAASSADLVVIGSAGAGPIASGLAGGVSRAILRRGESPVLVVGPLAR